MSSILDALNKLEQEKAQVEQEEERDIDPRQAARELIGGRPGRPGAVRLTPAALLLGAVVFMGAMIAVSVGVTIAIVGRTAPAADPVQTQPVAAQPEIVVPVAETPPPTPEPQPEPRVAAVVPSAVTPEPEPEPAPVEVVAPPVEQERKEAPVRVAAIAPPPPKAEPVASAPVEKPVEPVREPEPIIEAAPEPEPVVEQAPVVTARREPVAAPKPAPVVTDIRKLPPLTLAVSQRYGSEPILINMISPASPTRPYPYAIINRIKVTVGDPIGGSRLRLVEVENHGIAVEGGGQRYYVAF